MEEILSFGKKMVAQKLTYAGMGNISKRVGKEIIISRRGSMLDELEGNLIAFRIDEQPDKEASSDTPIHREIYKKTDAKSVLHGHAPYAVALSLIEKGNSIKPLDFESAVVLNEIPLIDSKEDKEALAKDVAAALTKNRGCIVRGHGPYTKGKTVEEAFTIVAIIEHACHVKYLVDIMKAGKE